MQLCYLFFKHLWAFWVLLLISNISSVQSLSCVRLFATPWIAASQASLSITNSWSSLRLKSIKSVMPPSHLILCRPLLLLPPLKDKPGDLINLGKSVSFGEHTLLWQRNNKWTFLLTSTDTWADLAFTSWLMKFKHIHSFINSFKNDLLTYSLCAWVFANCAPLTGAYCLERKTSTWVVKI